MWVKGLLEDIGIKLHVRMLCDCEAAIADIKSGRTDVMDKHIDVKYHHVKEHVLNGNIQLEYVNTKRNIADIFTKALSRNLHHNHRQSLGLIPIWPGRRSIGNLPVSNGPSAGTRVVDQESPPKATDINSC